MDFQGNVSDVLMQLDGLRLEKGLSYQAVADGCGLSKSTVCRILSGQSEPTIQQLQVIAATVQYKPEGAMVIPQDATQEAHIAYLKELIQKQSQERMTAGPVSSRPITICFISRTGGPLLCWGNPGHSGAVHLRVIRV